MHGLQNSGLTIQLVPAHMLGLRIGLTATLVRTRKFLAQPLPTFDALVVCTRALKIFLIILSVIDIVNYDILTSVRTFVVWRSSEPQSLLRIGRRRGHIRMESSH